MNKRIRELAEQAGAEIYGHPDYATICVNGQDADDLMKKFAELIVRECIVDFYRNCLDITSNEDITVQVERYVQEHFGVEE